jgi:hypothetical protein
MTLKYLERIATSLLMLTLTLSAKAGHDSSLVFRAGAGFHVQFLEAVAPVKYMTYSHFYAERTSVTHKNNTSYSPAGMFGMQKGWKSGLTASVNAQYYYSTEVILHEKGTWSSNPWTGQSYESLLFTENSVVKHSAMLGLGPGYQYKKLYAQAQLAVVILGSEQSVRHSSDGENYTSGVGEEMTVDYSSRFCLRIGYDFKIGKYGFFTELYGDCLFNRPEIQTSPNFSYSPGSEDGQRKSYNAAIQLGYRF